MDFLYIVILRPTLSEQTLIKKSALIIIRFAKHFFTFQNS